MFWTAIILITLTILFWDFVKKQRVVTYFHKHGLAGPSISLPLIGDVFVTLSADPKNILNFMRYLLDRYGKVCRLWIFHLLFIVVQDVQYLEPILSSQRLIKKGFAYDMLRGWLNDGLLLSNSHKWHARRKIITRSYHFSILEQFLEVFDRQSEIFVKRLRGKADGKTAIDIFPEVCLTALDIITETAMGVKINAQKYPNVPYVKALTHTTHALANRIMQPAFYIDIVYNLTHVLDNMRLKKSIQIMHDFTDGIIRERREALNKSLAEKGQKETEAQAEFEVQQVFNKNESESITMSDMQNLKYLECVIKEALRLYPSVPIISRVTEEEFKIGNLILPPNTNVVMPLYAVARDPKYFANPDDFLPERFLVENTTKINPFAFVPFSAGPRNCVGQKFAMLEMKMIVGKVLRDYELLPLGPEVVPIVTLILRSTTGVHVGLKPRA
uniref:Cytochrome P450 n=1 Tax=Glossina brevipalpis TaxID=37001 RepID=A0A1A9W297_9MUSC